ncbi:phenylacetate--CoA ligase family protein [Aquisalibacillus elongatus]|uniref:Phenylacetate-CoA ligase n=1 Tax=Aquisalibacillus elongatus TaxID=485577 RepID=A0A3N5C246_9BACI|nr:AMP-binding protein [Aquisalibacillus elongatus]RPF53432.1 phenylacetate-CoA ligase [Aquisalibacillus elongatus]
MNSSNLKKLNCVIQHARKSPFYKQRLPTQPLTTIQELKDIPLTTKEDLRQHSPNGLRCVPNEDLYQYHESSGTTGNPVSSWFTKEDVYHNAKQIASCGIQFHDKDIVLIRFPYALSAAAHMIHEAVQLKGACVIPASGRTTSTPFTKIVDLMKKLDVTVLSCLSLQTIMIAETAEILGLNPKDDFPHLRAICTAGETLSPARRQLIQEIWGIPVYEFYGMTEIGTSMIDCKYQNAHVLDDDFIVEILDDSLTEDVQPNEFGHLVITTLKKDATPMIRYHTGDRARLRDDTCLCGRKQMIEIRGRSDDTLLIDHKKIDIWDIEEIISYLPCRRFWRAGVDQQKLKIIIEKEQETDHVSPTFQCLLEAKFDIPMQIELVPTGTIYNREKLISNGLNTKPKYFYSGDELNVR